MEKVTAIIFGLVGALISIDPFGSKIDAYVFVALLCPLCAAASYLIVRKYGCLLYTSPSPRDGLLSRMPSSA